MWKLQYYLLGCKGGVSVSALRAYMMAAAVVVSGGVLWAQGTLTAKLDPSGMVQVLSGETEVAMIELNVHAPGWKNGPQASATARVSDVPGGKRFVGVLPVPDSNGGALDFAQTVKSLPQGLDLDYDVTMTKAMKLSGLQVSVDLPTAIYGGKDVLIVNPDAESRTATLPQEQMGDNFQIWSGDGARVEVARGTPEAVIVELQAAAGLIIQDLRRWQRPTFEIRIPAIMDDAGRDVTTGDRLHLHLTVTFARPVTLTGP